jgi:hypothetical protein
MMLLGNCKTIRKGATNCYTEYQQGQKRGRKRTPVVLSNHSHDPNCIRVGFVDIFLVLQFQIRNVHQEHCNYGVQLVSYFGKKKQQRKIADKVK